MEILDVMKGSYTRDLLKSGKRLEPRGFMDFREITIKTGVIEHAEGSAQVDLGLTRVLAGVKLIPEEPMEDTPGQGNLIVNAELLPLASPEYETGPPSPVSIELSRVVDRGIRAANCINLEKLAIDEENVWTAFIDLYVLNYGGNLFDASSLAAMAALLNTKVPKYEDGKVIREERVKSLDIENIVTSTTFGKIGGEYLLLDMNMNEEAIADARLTIATDGKEIRAMQKGLNGSLKIEEIEKLVTESMSKNAMLKEILEKSRR